MTLPFFRRRVYSATAFDRQPADGPSRKPPATLAQ
jgi:hypothetical protein